VGYAVATVARHRQTVDKLPAMNGSFPPAAYLQSVLLVCHLVAYTVLLDTNKSFEQTDSPYLLNLDTDLIADVNGMRLCL
jgi:hypothetical protein